MANYTVTATDAGGHQAQFTGTIATGATFPDGSANAPPGTPQNSTLLSGYLKRPPWKVAGVDYAVGCHPGITLKKPSATNMPANATWIPARNTINATGPCSFSGFDLTGIEIRIYQGTGPVTVTDCVDNGSSSPIITNTDVTQPVIVRYCTLDGGSTRSDYAKVRSFAPLTVEYCWIKNAEQGIFAQSSLIARYNCLQAFEFQAAGHPNAIYIAGNSGQTAVDISYNLIWSGLQSTGAKGLGAGVAYFSDGGNFPSTHTDSNTFISSFNMGADYFTGFYTTSGHVATGTFSTNYFAMVTNGAYGYFYPGGQGTNNATYTGNIDMVNGKTIHGDNSES